MRELVDKAMRAASQVFDDVAGASLVETESSGVAVFAVDLRRGGSCTVHLNPNGLGAGVEWRGRSGGDGYRTLRLQGSLPAEISP